VKIVPRNEFVNLLQTRGSKKLQEHLPRYDVDMILGRGECAVHEGGLTQSEDWRLVTPNLLVLGSLSCGGLVDIAPEGSGDWGGSLWTLGDLKCRNFAGHFGASVIVDGDLIVAELAVQAFEDSMLLVTGDFTARFFYGEDIWAEVGGKAVMEYGDGYALPLGFDNAKAQAVNPRHKRRASLALLNLDDEEGAEELVAKLRRGEHFRAET
jgi:hypothetical protein